MIYVIEVVRFFLSSSAPFLHHLIFLVVRLLFRIYEIIILDYQQHDPHTLFNLI